MFSLSRCIFQSNCNIVKAEWKMCLKKGDESNRKSIDPKIKFSVQIGCIDDSICMDSQQKPTFGFCLNSASLDKKKPLCTR